MSDFRWGTRLSMPVNQMRMHLYHGIGCVRIFLKQPYITSQLSHLFSFQFQFFHAAGMNSWSVRGSRTGSNQNLIPRFITTSSRRHAQPRGVLIPRARVVLDGRSLAGIHILQQYHKEMCSPKERKHMATWDKKGGSTIRAERIAETAVLSLPWQEGWLAWEFSCLVDAPQRIETKAP